MSDDILLSIEDGKKFWELLILEGHWGLPGGIWGVDKQGRIKKDWDGKYCILELYPVHLQFLDKHKIPYKKMEPVKKEPCPTCGRL